MAIVQGLAEKFISITALQAALELDFGPDVVGEFSIFVRTRIFLSLYLMNLKSCRLAFNVKWDYSRIICHSDCVLGQSNSQNNMVLWDATFRSSYMLLGYYSNFDPQVIN